jgi:hypothetical protein
LGILCTIQRLVLSDLGQLRRGAMVLPAQLHHHQIAEEHHKFINSNQCEKYLLLLSKQEHAL